MRRSLAPIVIVALCSVGQVPSTTALLTDSVTVGANSLATATLDAPTGAGATGSCNGAAPEVTVTWTMSSSTFADGYDIGRALISGGAYTVVGSVGGRTTTSYVDTSVVVGTTYYYIVRATAHSWESGDSNEASASTPAVCL